jgi:hypothetical protein
MDGNGNKTIILKYMAILYSFEEKFKSFFFRWSILAILKNGSVWWGLLPIKIINK